MYSLTDMLCFSKTVFTKTSVGWIWSTGHSLLTPEFHYRARESLLSLDCIFFSWLVFGSDFYNSFIWEEAHFVFTTREKPTANKKMKILNPALT